MKYILPTNNYISLAFIINASKNRELLFNSIQSNELDDNIKKKILPKWFYNHYVKGGFHNYDPYETER